MGGITVLQEAKRVLDQCRSIGSEEPFLQHYGCPNPSEPLLPTRVIDVSTIGDVRLHISHPKSVVVIWH